MKFCKGCCMDRRNQSSYHNGLLSEPFPCLGVEAREPHTEHRLHLLVRVQSKKIKK